MTRQRRRAPGLQRGIIILPSAFTLGNLFFGIHSMVAAARLDFEWAAWSIVLAALLDLLDGRVARFTATGSRFGAELDSLVDAISFGVAPAFLAYQLFFTEDPWSWVVSFIYVTAVVTRLARFNVEQGGEAKRTFHGLPSPTAGMLVATMFPFFTAPAVTGPVGGLPSPQTTGMFLVVLALLMVSHIPYPVVPRLSMRSTRAGIASAALLGSAITALTVPEYFLFPFLALYTLWGVSRAMLLGLLERLPDQDPLLDEPAPVDEGGMEPRRLDYGELAPGRFPTRRSTNEPEKDER